MIYSANYSLKEPQKNVDLADVNDLNYNTEAIDGLIHNTQISLAPAYDQTSTYAVGDLVMYETVLYKCIIAITVAEAWDSTKWERTYLSENAGGGGNANVTEITYSQYSALTPAEKANGTIYCVTNDPNDSSSGGRGLQFVYLVDIIFNAVRYKIECRGFLTKSLDQRILNSKKFFSF